LQGKTITDPSGRAVVTFHDDRGAPYKFASNAVDVTGNVNFVDAIAIPLHADETQSPPRPCLTHGQILITGQSSLAAGSAHDFLLADVRVTGYVGSIGTVIGRAQIGGDQPMMRVTFDDEDTFDRIVIEARQCVDGDFSTVVAAPGVLLVAAVALMWG